MKSYTIRSSTPPSVQDELSLHPTFLIDLLYSRGIDTKEKAEHFLNPSYDTHTHDPFLIAGMEKAVERILKGIKDNERITIWSDYDHDGIPGGVILHDFFKKINYQNFSNYIPHRYTEGYGLNSEGIEKLKGEGTTLIITVDSGITDVEPVAFAQSIAVDVIVTDHHIAQVKLPDAFVILNSKQEHCEYPYPFLCGAAVSFKLVQALIARGNFGIAPGWEKWLLDLVGLSTVADMVPLTGENRVLASYGLTVLKKTRRPGLLKLMRRSRLNPRLISEDDVGFTIAPRINAASRMGDPRLAFELLTTTDEDGKADAYALELEKLNEVRKGVVASMVKEMKHSLKEKIEIPSLIVMGSPSWRPGLLGLAASSVMEEHDRPVFLWGREGGDSIKGSCRSNGSVNVVQLMEKVGNRVFSEFGGHAFSGGFSVLPEKVHYLEEHLLKAYEAMPEVDSQDIAFIDRKLSIDEVDMFLWDLLVKLAPYGVENPKPLFLFENEIVESVRLFGKKSEHLEVVFKNKKGTLVKAISFFNAKDKERIKEGEQLSFVGHVEYSNFGFKPELRIRIVDLI